VDGTNTLAHVRLLTLGVQTAFRRQGIGRALVHGIARRLRASSCEQEMRAVGSLPVDGIHRSTILILADVAHSNTSGKCFYSCLGMNEESGSHLGPRFTTGTHLVAGLLAV